MPVLEGEGFFDAPWPSDLRRGEGGGPDLTGFPRRDEIDLLDSYAQVGESLYGFGNNSPIFVRFEEPIDRSLLPDAELSATLASPVLLVNVDRDSPFQNELVPFEWDFQQTETAYQPACLLAVAPVHGFPLRPDTTYALVVLDGIAGVGEQMRQAWDPSGADYETWELLIETLFQLGIDNDAVAAATVFTTQDPVAELAEYATYINYGLDLPRFDATIELEMLERNEAYDLYEGRTFLPLFQEGERPYASEGGALHRNEDGEPRAAAWEYIRFSLTVPNDQTQPEGGWPLYIYSHGTGGDCSSHTSDSLIFQPAELLARRGFVGLAIDQPLHGERATESTDPELHSFNYLNLDAARANFRQGALDQIFLAAALAQGAIFFPPNRDTVPIDTERMVFLGHSQGGLSGALAGPFLGRELQAMFLSGAGGVISLSILQRQEGYDLVELLGALLDLDSDELLDSFHPTLGLVQWLADVTDPINYAPYWYDRQPDWASTPIHVGLSEGLLDGYTPYQTTEALAAAANLPLLQPAVTRPLAHELLGLDEQQRPVSGNMLGYDGEPITAGLAQYGDQGHYAVFDDSTAAQNYIRFLVSATQAELPSFHETQ